MSTKFDEYPNNSNLTPEEEKKFNAKVLVAFMVGAFLAVIGFILDIASLQAIGCLIMILTGFYLIALLLDYFKKNKQEEKENNRKILEKIKTEESGYDKLKYNNQTTHPETFDIIQSLKIYFVDEIDQYASDRNIIVLNKQSDYLFNIYIKINLENESIQLYCPFCHFKTDDEVDIPYGVYYTKLNKFLNELNLEYVAYKFYREGITSNLGFVSRDYPLIKDESIIKFLENEIEVMLKLLDEVFPKIPKDYL